MNEKIEEAFLVVECQVYDEVILVFELRDHVLIKVDQQTFARLLEHILDHV